MIDLKDLGVLYNVLLGFGITMVVELLKWLGQYPTSKHAFAIAMMFFKQSLSFIMHLKCLYGSLLEQGADILLHLTMVLVNSSSENSTYNDEVYDLSSFRTFSFTWRN